MSGRRGSTVNCGGPDTLTAAPALAATPAPAPTVAHPKSNKIGMHPLLVLDNLYDIPLHVASDAEELCAQFIRDVRMCLILLDDIVYMCTSSYLGIINYL